MPQGYGMPSPYGQPYGPAPVAQHVPPGDLAAFLGQPRTGRPKAISWNGVPLGTTVVGYVVEDVGDRDIVPDTDPKTNLVKTWRDGSPKYVLVVTLSVQPSALHPDGKASLYCRGDLWDKLSAAMAAAGRTGAPKAGDMIAATLTERRATPGQAVPKNLFTVQYALGDAASPQPLLPSPQVQQYAPAPEPAQQMMPPAAQVPAPAPQYAAPQAPLPAQAFTPQQQPAPAPVAAAPLPVMSPEQAALLARIKGVQA
jgi:hypothetical protein